MKRFNLLILLFCLILVSACSPQTTPTPTNTPQPTNTPEPTLTPTPIPPFTGKLFFDMNGSGLQNESSFIYDPERLADPRQSLQPDLNQAINDYVISHPDLKDGNLITISEPGLSGYQVCIENECATTSQDGSFEIQNKTERETALLKIIDPNKDVPILAMRYINEWKSSVIVPEYSKKVDESTMKSFEIIPDCEDDGKVFVCKRDFETLIIREQQLNNNELVPIKEMVNIDSRNKIELGLMQGFLTSPFVNDPSIWLWSYVDLNYDLGKISNFQGENVKPNYQYKISGTGDQHQGIDWETKIGSILISVSQGQVISVYNGDEGNAAKQIRILFQPGDQNGYTADYGHNSVNLIGSSEKVYRGQIIGLAGKSGSEIPHLHYGMFQVPKYVRDNSWVVENVFLNGEYQKVTYPNGDLTPTVYDPFRNLNKENSFSLWSVDNLIVTYP